MRIERNETLIPMEVNELLATNHWNVACLGAEPRPIFTERGTKRSNSSRSIVPKAMRLKRRHSTPWSRTRRCPCQSFMK